MSPVLWTGHKPCQNLDRDSGPIFLRFEFFFEVREILAISAKFRTSHKSREMKFKK